MGIIDDPDYPGGGMTDQTLADILDIQRYAATVNKSSPNRKGSKMSGEMDGNSLIAALAGDATTIGGAFIAADVAKTTVKKNPGSANTLIIAGAAVAGLIVLVILLKK